MENYYRGEMLCQLLKNLIYMLVFVNVRMLTSGPVVAPPLSVSNKQHSTQKVLRSQLHAITSLLARSPN